MLDIFVNVCVQNSTEICYEQVSFQMFLKVVSVWQIKEGQVIPPDRNNKGQLESETL